MACAAPITTSTKETTNYARLCRLLVDVGTQALRNIFDSIHVPGSLHTDLASPPAQTILQCLYKPKKGKKKVLNPNQWGKLYPTIPTSVSSANFDITLLMILLRNICGLTPPATGWDTLPATTDLSIEADIARVKYFRNVVYGHAEQASVDDVSFSNFWQDIKATLVRLGGTSYGAAIDQLQNACMDPEVEEHYKELLKQWKKDEDSIKDQLNEMETDIKYVRKTLDDLREKVSPEKESTVEEIASCEADITFFAERYDPDTRRWLLNDFDKWFSDPGDSRAYVLLGDPGVGKSVMAGVLAQRSKKAENLGAAYFCRHNDGTRNDPRYLLGTIACQLCKCNSQYNSIVGGEGGVRKLLGNSNLGVQELFSKLLQEPLGKCNPFQQKKLVIIDALDETQYESREDFLDLIMHRFPLLPKWLVFFITSRPEDSVQFRLKKYNPCIKICAGSSENLDFYQQHERDIKLFLEKNVDFGHLPYSVEDITKTCNGLFLYAFYIARILKDPVHSGKIDQLSNLFPEDIDNFFLQNFKRVFDKVGTNLYQKLFGCAIVAPSPLPLSFISFILKRENLDLDEQEVIDAVSQFVVLRTSDQTFTFLHNLIPTWLTDKKKASRKLFIDRIKAGEYFRDVIVEFLSAGVVNQRWQKPPSIEADLFDYCFRVGVRFLCEYREKHSLKIVYSCLTSYQFIWQRIQNNGIEIYSVIADLKVAIGCQSFTNVEKEILQEMCLAFESNVHVLRECPNLLHSCLRNASNAVQTNVLIPDGVSTTWMEWKGFLNPACEILRDMSCFALSPDKKLLAGGKGQSIFLFEAYSLGKVEGPFRVMERGDEIVHLEFSPDGEYVFFGRLDQWFSLKERCLRTFAQFSGMETRCYSWSFFTSNGRYIVVKGKNPLEQNHNLSCLLNIFCRWATQELHRVRSNEITLSCRRTNLHFDLSQYCSLSHLSNNHSRHFRYPKYTMESLLDLLSVLKTKKTQDWCRFLENHLSSHQALVNDCGDGGGRQALANPLCSDCYKFYHNHRKTTLADARQRVIDLYQEIFEYQVWNVRTGKSALEEAFSSDVALSPFFYLCHMMTALENLDGKVVPDVEKKASLHAIAFMMVVYFLVTNVNQWSSSFFSVSFLDSPFFVRNVPVEFHNLTKSKSRVSLDGNWKAVRNIRRSISEDSSFEFLPLDGNWNEDMNIRQSFSLDIIPGYRSTIGNLIKVRERRQSVNSENVPVAPFLVTLSEKYLMDGKAVHIDNVQHFAFTDDSNALLYVTEEKSLHALNLQTGNILSSVSGLSPLFYAPEKQLGYMFCVQDLERVSFAENFRSSLPSEILFCPGKTLVTSTFIPASTILSSFSDPLSTSWKTTREFHMKKCVFSQDGNLIATHKDTKILLFDFSKSLCSLCDDRYHENDVSCLTFSPDSTLLLYFIQNRRGDRTDDLDFYVWDVQNRVLSASFDSPSELLSIDCCCFSSDNTKFLICGEFSIEVWEYASPPCRLLAKVEINVPGLYTEIDKFTHCTVLPKSDLLACCIVDKILLYELNNATDPQSILQLPRAHLGKIEFCQFLKGNRYLISYGVDGTVFLWDLSKWKAIAYAKVAEGRESIVGMGVFPEEDEVVCLTSLGRTSMLKLCGLVNEIPSTFPTTEAMNRRKMAVANRRHLGEPASSTFESVASDEVEAMDWTEYVEDMNIMADENLESEDDICEGESDE